MTALLMTGFPGFLGSALLGRLLARATGRRRAVCLVQDRHLGEARERLAGIEADEPHVAGRVRLVRGRRHGPRPRPDHRRRARCSRTSPRCGTSPPSTTSTVGEELAHRVNVVGTDRVLDLCRGLAAPRAAPPRQHLLRQRALRGRVRRGRARRRPGVPQPLRVDQVRRRDAGAQGDGRRPARDDLPARDRGGRLPHRRDAEVRRPLLPGHLPAPPAPRRRRPRRRRPRQGALLPGPARLRHRRDGPAVGDGRSRWAGPTPSPTPTRRPLASWSTAFAAPAGQAGGLGAAAAGADPRLRSRCHWSSG